MSSINVLVVDDSVVYRSQIRSALSRLPWVNVVGVSSNGRLAVEKLLQTPVDLMILDLEMPEMDGIQTLIEMQKLNIKSKVLMFASSTKRSSEITLEALKRGATDFMTKPNVVESADPKEDPAEKIFKLLEPKLQALFRNTTEVVKEDPVKEVKEQVEFTRVHWDIFQPEIMVIGSSTGGPTALEKIFSQLSGPFHIPVVIVQHMPPVFTATFAERLEKLCGVRTKEAQNNEVLQAGTVYVAPGDYHLRLKKNGANILLTLDKGPQIHSVRPAVDPLFESASEIFNDKVLGVILTGMGYDGKAGAIAVKKKHGAVVIQNKESCVVFGMPGAVHEAGAYDKMIDINTMANIVGPKITNNVLSKKTGSES